MRLWMFRPILQVPGLLALSPVARMRGPLLLSPVVRAAQVHGPRVLGPVVGVHGLQMSGKLMAGQARRGLQRLDQRGVVHRLADRSGLSVAVGVDEAD